MTGKKTHLDQLSYSLATQLFVCLSVGLIQWNTNVCKNYHKSASAKIESYQPKMMKVY